MLTSAVSVTNGKATTNTGSLDQLMGVLSEQHSEPSAGEVSPPSAKLAEPSILRSAPVPDEDQRAGQSPASNEFAMEQGVARISQALQDLFRFAREPGEREKAEREQREALSTVVAQTVEEVCALRRELADVRSKTESEPPALKELRAAFDALEGRCKEDAAEQRTTRSQILELLDFRTDGLEQLRRLRGEMSALGTRVPGLHQVVDRIDTSLKSLSQTVVALSSRHESLLESQAALEQRLAEQQSALGKIQADSLRTGRLLDRFFTSLQMLDARVDGRHSVDKEIKLVKVGQEASSIAGRVVDASNNGLGLTLPAAVPPGTQVHLEIDTVALVGQVAHCRQNGESYSVGLSSVRPLEARPGGEA
ncbi:MAG: PilZ domain-containing protein [Bryobacteraceae bacterium]